MTRPANWFHTPIWLLLLCAPMPSPSQDRTEARSMVISRHGIVATSQTLASQAGAQVLARGGSAPFPVNVDCKDRARNDRSHAERCIVFKCRP